MENTEVKNKTLTIREAVSLATIIGWCQRNARLEWLVPDGGGRTNTGIARCIGDEWGNFLHQDEDIRDAFVRITTSSGLEWFAPISEIVALEQRFEIVEQQR